MEERIVRGKGERRKKKMKKELNREEVRKMIKKLKDGKAMRVDGISKYGSMGKGKSIEE